MPRRKIKHVYYRRFLIPLLSFLKQGITPQKLSLTLCLGIVLGIVPFIGVNTLLLTLLAIVFKLNLVAIQLVNYFFYPAQIFLYLPFLKAGQWIFNGPAIPFTGQELLTMFRENWLETVLSIWHINVLGLLVWFILGIPFSLAIYYFSLPFFKKHARKFNERGF
jgi:hypothetical protein